MDVGTVVKGMTWWNGLTDDQRSYWLTVAGTGVPADAYAAYLAHIKSSGVWAARPM